MRILNLYAGIGGNRKLWSDEHEIVAVESEQYIADVYKGLYPNDTVVVGDAHQYLLDHFQEFDFIWSSPPCPTHSRARFWGWSKKRPVYPDMSLYQEVLFLKHFYKGEWCVENVTPYYKPLIEPQATIERHLVWASKPLWSNRFGRSYKGTLGDQSVEVLQREYGIELPEGTKNKRKLLRNAVSPEFGKYIFESLTEGVIR